MRPMTSPTSMREGVVVVAHLSPIGERSPSRAGEGNLLRTTHATALSPSKPAGKQNWERGTMSLLQQSIFDTVHFFDLFDMPVTVTQIWQYLIRVKSGYSHTPALKEIRDLLSSSNWLQAKLEMQWGYVVKRGRLPLVRDRMRRHAIAQDKWKIVRRCAPFLAFVPFVQALAGSGSLALDNTKHSSDLDILVIVQKGRIWTARLFLLCISQFLGRRRKYYAASAPDMLCLNHYVSSSSLVVSKDIQNICMAMQYALLVPIFHDDGVRTFLQRNSRWMDAYVRIPAIPSVLHRYTIRLSSFAAYIKRQLELLLLEPIGDIVERWAERLQQWVMFRHAVKQGGYPHSGRIVLTANELAFHPDTKVPAIVQAFTLDG